VVVLFLSIVLARYAHFFKERYTSLVTLDPPKSIVVSSINTNVLDVLETK